MKLQRITSPSTTTNLVMIHSPSRRAGRILQLVAFMLWIMMVPVPSARAGKTVATTSTPKYMQIPIMYVTDRAISGETFGPRRRYPMHCQHQMYYGTAFVTVPNTDGKSDPKLLEHLGWKPTNTKEAKVSPKDRIDPADPVASKTAFFARLKKTLEQSGSNDLCVFVHGAEDAFEDSMQDAASLAYSFEQPLIMYSWPSDPHIRGYFIDSSNNEWSQGHFNTFYKDLIDFNAQYPIKVTSISHSMGNRLVIRALPVVYGKGLVTNWELISPDMDADTCRHYIMGLTQSAGKIRLYVSNRDKMLPISQMLAGGYYRVGEAANPLAMPPNWKDSESSFERIDFTAVDKGFRGHSIPSDLVSSIVKTSTPGPGLELVGESELKANRLIRFANKSQHLSDLSKGLPDEYCKRVVKLDKNDGAKQSKTKKKKQKVDTH